MILFTILFSVLFCYYIQVIPDSFGVKIYIQILFSIICGLSSWFLLIRKFSQRNSSFYYVAFFVLCVLISCIFSVYPLYSLIYFVIYVLILPVAYIYAVEFYRKETINANLFIVFFSIAIVMSLILYLIFNKGYTVEAGLVRVSGVFGEPAKLSSVCALNVGCVFYSGYNRFFKSSLISMSLLCLYLTGTRTGWVAIILPVLYIYYISKHSKLQGALVFCAIAIFVTLSFNFLYTQDSSNYLRKESIVNMSGRSEMWKVAIANSYDEPLGYGFCLGGFALYGDKNKITKNNFSLSFDFSSTGMLHSGYVQAFCDLGYIGFVAYILLFAVVLKKTISLSCLKQYRGVVYIFLCYATINFTESTIISPKSFDVLAFWFSWFVISLSASKLSKEGDV